MGSPQTDKPPITRFIRPKTKECSTFYVKHPRLIDCFYTASGTFYVNPYAPLAKEKSPNTHLSKLMCLWAFLSVPRAGLEPAQPSLAKGF